MIWHGLKEVRLPIPPQTQNRCRAFYGGLLELSEIPRPVAESESGEVWFDLAGFRLRLYPSHQFRPLRESAPILTVSGRDQLVERLVAHGVPVGLDHPAPRDPGETAWLEEAEVGQCVLIEDPGGNYIGLAAPDT